MRPEVFLDVADELAHLGGPGRLRSAVSRAYYAVFQVASEASATRKELASRATNTNRAHRGSAGRVLMDPFYLVVEPCPRPSDGGDVRRETDVLIRVLAAEPIG